MTSTAMKHLKEQVLGLSEKDRAELVRDLIASLDGPADDGVEDAWAEEITRRIQEIKAGSSPMVEAADVMDRIAIRVRGAK